MHWGARAEAYLTPVGPELVGVALLTEERAPFAAQLAGFPELAERFAGACPAGDVMGAGPLRTGAAARRRGRVLLVGDAAGYVDAITGEGVALALGTARALAACLARGRPDLYEAEWRRITRGYRLMTGALMWARRRPALAGRIVPTAAALPWVFTAAVDAVSRTR
ncbi:hypothetical protein [Yinghuangia soli]|uniref:hypothetical protein n=1 Tax=Yinghuangia soli TaxID=2908204 RepID=UPI003557B3B4